MPDVGSIGFMDNVLKPVDDKGEVALKELRKAKSPEDGDKPAGKDE